MKSISILGCGWLGLPLGKHLAEDSLLVKGSTTSKSKLSLIKDAGVIPFHFQLQPKLEGNTDGFFDSDILLVNLPPRNKDGIENFHKSQLNSIIHAADGQIKHIVFISSTAVYPAENEEVKESNASSSCLSRGGVPLLEMEKLFVDNERFTTTVIRFGGLYGPNRHPGRFLTGKKDLAGANNPVNMIHLEDCIGVIHAIIEQNIWGEVLNACAPSHDTRQSFYEKAAHSLNLEPPTFSNKPASFKKVNSDKLLKLTGYKFKH